MDNTNLNFFDRTRWASKIKAVKLCLDNFEKGDCMAKTQVKVDESQYHFSVIMENLGIKPAFVRSYENDIAKIFGGALLVVWEDKKSNPNDDHTAALAQARNRCLHVASSIVQVGGDQTMVKKEVTRLWSFAKKFDGGRNTYQTATTLITVAVLADLLKSVDNWARFLDRELLNRLKKARPQGVPKGFALTPELCSLFEECDWMVGSVAACELGLARQKVL